MVTYSQNGNTSLFTGEAMYFFSAIKLLLFLALMRASVFFVCLCILILKGKDDLYSGTNHNSISCTSARNYEQTHQTKSVISNQDYTVIKNTNSDKQGEHLISEDAEDEDGDNLFTRKYKLLTRCYLPQLFIANLSYLYSHVKAPQPLCSHLSHKCIIQKVLRI